MERRVINPWTWQEQYGFVQAMEIQGMRRMLICSGQTAINAEGHAVHAGDMRGQLTQALDNLETVLQAAGFTLADVVRLNVYTTDMDRFFEAADVLGGRMAGGGGYATSYLGVARLAFPELLIELEATAVA